LWRWDSIQQMRPLPLYRLEWRISAPKLHLFNSSILKINSNTVGLLIRMALRSRNYQSCPSRPLDPRARLDANSELCKKTDTEALWRPVGDIFEAMREELGPNICAFSEGELAESAEDSVSKGILNYLSYLSIYSWSMNGV